MNPVNQCLPCSWKATLCITCQGSQRKEVTSKRDSPGTSMGWNIPTRGLPTFIFSRRKGELFDPSLITYGQPCFGPFLLASCGRPLLSSILLPKNMLH